MNACLTPICLIHGMAITTVEGIGSTETRLHPVQVSGVTSLFVFCGGGAGQEF